MLRKHFTKVYFEDTAVLLFSLLSLYLSISVRQGTHSAKLLTYTMKTTIKRLQRFLLWCYEHFKNSVTLFIRCHFT